MRRSLLFFSLLLAAVQSTVAITQKELKAAVSNNQLPGGYIVELSSDPQNQKRDVHGEFLAELDKRAAGKFVTRQTFDSPLFNGMAVQLKSEKDLSSLTKIPGVVSVRPITIHQRPKPVSLVKVSKPTDKAVFPDGQSTHVMTGVDKAHAAGFTGKGIKIAIVDTGVDYTHPSLGGKFGKGNKVAGGYDLVGDAYNGQNTPKPDNDPMDSCGGHGTHVAGIIGANPGNQFNISGVAYDAELYSYRVFGCEGGVGDDIIVAALLRAHKDGADVITASLGIPNGWSSEWSSVIASRIAKEGKVVTIAAGNDGMAGSFFTSSPGTGKDVISVASVENTVLPYPYITTSRSDSKIFYDIASFPNPQAQPIPVGEKPFPVYALSKDPNAIDVGCKPLGPDVPDLSGYAVLVSANYSDPQSDCNYVTQADNLRAKNTSMVIYHDNTDDTLVPVFGYFNAILLQQHSDAVSLYGQLAKDPKLTVTFAQTTVDVPVENGGLVSDFSSFGPSNELLFKPAIAAPGGNITSTYMVKDGSWAVMSGTSMATPFLAGSSALLLQAKGKKVSPNVRGIFQSTSRGVPVSKDAGALPQTLAQQGSGLIDVFAAINSKTIVSPAELLTNDTANWKSSHTITIQNNAKKAQTYKLTHQAAGTTVTVPNGETDFTPYPVPLINAPSDVKLSATKITVQPGKTAKVTVTIQPPKKVDSKTLPIISGWINVRGDRGDFVKVSYMGVAGSLRKAQAISVGNDELVPEDGGLPALLSIDDNEDMRAQRGLRNYKLGGEDWPYFAFDMAVASHRVTVDLVPSNTNIKSTIRSPFPPSSTPSKREWSGWWPGLDTASANSAGTASGKPDSYSKVPTLGPVWEQHELRRSAFSFSTLFPFYVMEFPTEFANGTAVPLGEYRLLLRALRAGGDVHNEGDYDVYVSEPVGILPADSATSGTSATSTVTSTSAPVSASTYTSTSTSTSMSTA